MDANARIAFRRLVRLATNARMPETTNATEEFHRISEFMRTYLLLRLYRLTLLLGSSGAIVTALASESIRARGAAVILFLKIGAIAVSSAFAIMDFSAAAHWDRFLKRANETGRPIELRAISDAITLESVHRHRCG